MFLSEYAARNKVSHPVSVHLRKEQLSSRLDAWLSRKFDPISLSLTVRELEAAQPDKVKPDEDAQHEIAECDAKLRQLCAAPEAGADPVLVTSWMKETFGQHGTPDPGWRPDRQLAVLEFCRGSRVWPGSSLSVGSLGVRVTTVQPLPHVANHVMGLVRMTGGHLDHFLVQMHSLSLLLLLLQRALPHPWHKRRTSLRVLMKVWALRP
jgi:hypothetical protein